MMLCCLKVIPKLLSASCFWQMMDEGEKGWLQEGLYALRHDNAHNTSGSHTLGVKDSKNVLEVFR